MSETKDVLYFGCHREKGHYLFDRSLWKKRDLPSGFSHKKDGPNVDGGYCPQKNNQAEGQATLTHAHGYTVIAFWDRSVDQRQGSNSVFFVPGTLTFDDAWAQAKAAFPSIVARYTFPVVAHEMAEGDGA